MSRLQRSIVARAGMAVLTIGAVLAAGASGGVATAQSGPRHQAAASGWTHAAAWGSNTSGQLGDGSQTSSDRPVAVAGSGLGFRKVAGGINHSVAIAADGTVWTWGVNDSGQLGDGTTTARSTPVRVPGLADIVTIGAGDGFTLAAGSDGSLWSWGRNNSGQLGNGDVGGARPVPQQVPGLTDIVQLSVGTHHSLVVRADGTVWAWGHNSVGELGNGNTGTAQPVPQQVPGLTDIVQLSAGAFHSLAARADGTVWAWGHNSFGQLGDGTDITHHTPVKATGLSHITHVAAGDLHSLAVAGDGAVYTWGDNDWGQLGDGTRTRRFTPWRVPGLSGVVQADAADAMSVALRGDGTVWSWGYNRFGRLGDGTTIHRYSPVQVPGLVGVTRLDAGFAHSYGSHVLVIRAVPTPAFSIGFSPDGVSLPAGGSVTIQVNTIPLHGSIQTVHLVTGATDSALAPTTGLPPGVTASFSPPSIVAGGSSTLTLTADPNVSRSPGESIKVTVTGRSALPPTTVSATFDLLITDPIE